MGDVWGGTKERGDGPRERHPDLAHLIGCKCAQTILACYIAPDDATQRERSANRPAPTICRDLEARPSAIRHPALSRHKTKTPPATRVASGAITSEVWAWVELNYRPHAYQAPAAKVPDS